MSLLIRLPPELKERIVERAEDEHLSLNAFAASALEKRLAEPIPEEALSIQHALARRVLPLIFAGENEGRFLTYKALLQEIGRDPRTNGRMMGAICDLIDAASVLGGVPLIALWRVKTATGEDNPRAFANCPAFRKELLDQARRHLFTESDRRAIVKSLSTLKGKGNRAAWRFVEENRPEFVARRDATNTHEVTENMITYGPA